MSAEEGKRGQLHEAGGPSAPATASKTLLTLLTGYAAIDARLSRSG